MENESPSSSGLKVMPKVKGKGHKVKNYDIV